MAKTIFKKIIDGEIPCNKVYEDDEMLAFRDINPQAPTHILIIPKKEIATLNELSPDDAALAGRMLIAAARIAAQEGLAERGYRTVFNCNRDAGMEVPHLHLHLLGGRTFGWPPG